MPVKQGIDILLLLCSLLLLLLLLLLIYACETGHRYSPSAL